MHRVKPTDSDHAWKHDKSNIKLAPSCGKSKQDFTFDEILTGSENKPVYNAVARSHVCAAMDGYNAVIFAYGQTASGKTFTLVSTKFRDIGGHIELNFISPAMKNNQGSSLVP